MSLMPIAEVTFKSGLSLEEKEQICEKIGSLQGVFKPNAQKDQDKVLATFSGDTKSLNEMRKIDGVKRAKFSNLL